MLYYNIIEDCLRADVDNFQQTHTHRWKIEKLMFPALTLHHNESILASASQLSFSGQSTLGITAVTRTKALYFTNYGQFPANTHTHRRKIEKLMFPALTRKHRPKSLCFQV